MMFSRMSAFNRHRNQSNNPSKSDAQMVDQDAGIESHGVLWGGTSGVKMG